MIIKKLIFSYQFEDFILNIIKPSSSEFTQHGQYLVVYEDAYADTRLEILKQDEIMAKYDVPARDFEELTMQETY